MSHQFTSVVTCPCEILPIMFLLLSSFLAGVLFCVIIVHNLLSFPWFSVVGCRFITLTVSSFCCSSTISLSLAACCPYSNCSLLCVVLCSMTLSFLCCVVGVHGSVIVFSSACATHYECNFAACLIFAVIRQFCCRSLLFSLLFCFPAITHNFFCVCLVESFVGWCFLRHFCISLKNVAHLRHLAWCLTQSDSHFTACRLVVKLIVFFVGHRPFYTSERQCPQCQKAFEPLFVK